MFGRDFNQFPVWLTTTHDSYLKKAVANTINRFAYLNFLFAAQKPSTNHIDVLKKVRREEEEKKNYKPTKKLKKGRNDEDSANFYHRFGIVHLSMVSVWYGYSRWVCFFFSCSIWHYLFIVWNFVIIFRCGSQLFELYISLCSFIFVEAVSLYFFFHHHFG